MGIFQRLNKERGITVLLITHERDIAEYGTGSSPAATATSSRTMPSSTGGRRMKS